MYFTITKTTTEQDLKKQYHELVKIHHPDKPTGNKEIFQQVSAEYIAAMYNLKNPRKRIVDYKLYQVLRTQTDEILIKMDLKPLNELFPDLLISLIDLIKFPPWLEKYKPYVKMMLLAEVGDDFDEVIEKVISLIEKFVNIFRPKDDTNRKF